MPDLKVIQVLAELGIAAVALGILAALVFYLIKTHKGERDEWRKDSKEQITQTQEVIKDLTNVIRGINRDL